MIHSQKKSNPMDALRHLRVMQNVPGKIKFTSYWVNITSTLYAATTELFSFIMQSSCKRLDVCISPTSPHFLSYIDAINTLMNQAARKVIYSVYSVLKNL
jgi:hypothetical protein